LIASPRANRHVGQYAVRGATCTEKIQYDEASDTVVWTASPKGFYKGRSETFKGFEFVEQLVAHLPPRRLQLVRRYGAYSGKVRNQWQQRFGIYRLAPEAWKRAHQLRTLANQKAKPAAVDPPEAPDAWSRLRRQSWARLLQKIHEVNPFICPKCQGTMTVVAVIEDPAELAKIIEWAKKQEQEPLLSVCARSPPELALVST